MELRNKVATAISGAPFPSTASLRKADAAIAVVLEALKKPSEAMASAFMQNGAYWNAETWQAMLAAFRTEALGESQDRDTITP